MSLTHTFIVKISTVLEEESNIMSATLFIVVAKWYFGDSPFFKSANGGANTLSIKTVKQLHGSSRDILVALQLLLLAPSP